jgi:3',5'-cyclic AMP phosphodiesterase CpdA
MVRYFAGAFIAVLLLINISCSQQAATTNNVQIAFISDIHLSDIYGKFEDNNYQGVINPGNGRYVIARTMKAQLHSTRIFNENYFAFKAALDDVAKRGIKYVVLPGDFSDDGQPYNLRGIRKILDSYTSTYSIQFFAINGNHDPAAPSTQDAGKPDFLGKNGAPQIIESKEGLYRVQAADEPPVVITKDICKSGYEPIIKTLSNTGFYPLKSYKYWETPFSTYSYSDYSYDKAVAQSSFNNRFYLVDTLNHTLPDVSYLVEPVEGLWLLAIDGNVYEPSGAKENSFTKADLQTGGEYSNVIKYKQHVVKWVEKVVKESKRLNKTLITFSHYPMIDFYDGAGDEMKSLFGTENLQLYRNPDESVSQLFAKAGLRIHFAGHLHLNDTGIKKYEDGSCLVNIQVPALVGYPAAYKILTINSSTAMEIETVKLDSVTGFNELFPLYQLEYSRLQRCNDKEIWNKDILSSKNYKELIDWHLKELVRLRYLNNDWPADFKDFMLNANGQSLFKLAGIEQADTSANYKWTGFDMIVDFYRLLNADELALEDIGTERIGQYNNLIKAELNKNHLPQDTMQLKFHRFILIFNDLLNNSEPSDHFMIDLKDGKLTKMDHSKN